MNENQMLWAKETLEKIIEKLEKVSARSADKIPYTTVNGVHDDKFQENAGWWTNGFWSGMMWQMYVLTGKEFYKRIAQENEEKLDTNLMDYNKLDHDNGFKWLPTAVANFRFTGEAASKSRGLLAAGNLAGRYNTAGKFIRAWNNFKDDNIDRRGWAIIDCMMNLSLLYWASDETGDPRFSQIARNHADTNEQYFIRADGSANHIVEFDPQSGEMLRSYGGQGYDVGSSWTRGQGWAIYGFVISYMHTGEARYLNAAKRVANYFLAAVADYGYIPPIDFRSPAVPAYVDTSAGAIAACGLIEISKQVGELESAMYLNGAVKILRAMEEKYIDWTDNSDFLLHNSSEAYNRGRHMDIIYGDYFFIEAIMKLNGYKFNIW